MIEIDGSYGEGGGQVLRSSLSLSMITGEPVHIFNIRSKRKKSGLLRQHLAAVNAATQICKAKTEGVCLGAQSIKFVPGNVEPGEYQFAVGSAGSSILVFQTILPAIGMTEGEYKILLEGGTHNPLAPTFDFLEQSYCPVLRSMGLEVKLYLHRLGLHPVGGGRFTAHISSKGAFKPVHLFKRGKLVGRRAVATVSNLPVSIAERELSQLEKTQPWSSAVFEFKNDKKSPGTGNILTLVSSFEGITHTISEVSERNTSVTELVRRAVRVVDEYENSEAVVCKFLADQLLLPICLAGKGGYSTSIMTEHTKTNIHTIKKILNVGIKSKRISQNLWKFALE